MHCRRCLSFTLLTALAICVVSPLAAAEDYSDLLGQWNKLNEQIDNAYEELRTAPPEERETVKEKYVSLVNQANDELLPKLRNAALDAYRAAPNQDKQLAKLLVGMAANDSRHDEHKKVLQIAKPLIDNNCPIDAILALGGQSAYCLDDFDLAETYLQKAKDAGLLDFQGTETLDDIPNAKQAWGHEQELRAQEAKADDLPRVRLTTDKGDLVIELFENEAPQTVANFIHLVEDKFYDGLTFHRVIGGFMAQAGCPKGDGSGDAGYKIPCECYQDNHRKHFRGSLSMAKSSDQTTREPRPDTGGSQFFVTFRRTHPLDGKYTVFGRLLEGWDVLAKLQRREQNPFNTRPLPPPDKIVKAEVIRKRDHEYAPTKVETQSIDSGLPDTEPSPGSQPAKDQATDEPSSTDDP